jgi:demethylmenaquinone methyltransferase/2-methoxy-6-polyprenyl-1,4-benzoquinol methylase
VAIDHFSLIAGLYNKIGRFVPSKELLDILDLPLGGILLDAGGGTGRVSDALKKMVKGVIVEDASLAMLGYAKSKIADCICSQVENLPLHEDSIDRIVLIDALHHVYDQRKSLSELWRVLVPGGRLIVIEPDIRLLSVKVMAFLEKILLMRSHFINEREIAHSFLYLNAKISVFHHESAIWVLVEKVREL